MAKMVMSSYAKTAQHLEETLKGEDWILMLKIFVDCQMETVSSLKSQAEVRMGR